MPSFTLIIPTLGRTVELDRLFASLAAQEFSSFHCLVIDQNAGDLIDDVLDRWWLRINIRRLHSVPGVSRSRNLGLLHATGDIVAFPDDDCWYSDGLLSAVAHWFEGHPEFGILSVGARDDEAIVSGNRWLRKRCEIRHHNAFRTTFCSTLFVRRAVACVGERFDEAIGPGSVTGCHGGDETDYILDLLNRGVRGFYDGRWHVGHPRRDMLSGQIDCGRAIAYGRGMGYVLRKHSMRLLGAVFILYDVVRSGVVALRGDGDAAALCLQHARGIVSGWRFYHLQRGGSRT
jgi:glycosyltransferase involved in cell wall biosynthesis